MRDHIPGYTGHIPNKETSQIKPVPKRENQADIQGKLLFSDSM